MAPPINSPSSVLLFGEDQAAGLRQARGLPSTPPARVLAVTSGKGGVGKTCVSINLALALCAAGHKTVLLDADLGLANVDVLLGLQPTFTLSHVLDGRCRLQDVLIEGPQGLKIVPAASGQSSMGDLNQTQIAGLIGAFSDLDEPVDILVIDTAAGLGSSVTTLCRAAHEVIVVVCNEPASLTDAYALMKVLARDHGVGRFQILANQVRSATEGREVYENLCRVAARFLNATIEYLGSLPDDEWLRRSIQRQRAVVETYPGAPTAKVFRQLAERALQWPLPLGARGHLEFFVERMVAA